MSKLLCDNLGAFVGRRGGGGTASVLGAFHDRAEELLATALAASVPGVRAVVVQPCASPA